MVDTAKPENAASSRDAGSRQPKKEALEERKEACASIKIAMRNKEINSDLKKTIVSLLLRAVLTVGKIVSKPR